MFSFSVLLNLDSLVLVLGTCKYLKSIEVQLSVKDFGEGTNQPENMEMYKEQLDKLKVSFIFIMFRV